LINPLTPVPAITGCECGYSMVEIASPDDAFPGFFFHGSKPSRRSITAAKKRAKKKIKNRKA